MNPAVFSSTPPSTEIIRAKLKRGEPPVRHSPWPFSPTAGFARQAQTQRMIEPFVEAQRSDGCISYGLSSYGYDARVVRRVQDLHQRRQRDRRPQGFRRQQLRRPQDRRLHHPAQQLRAGPDGRIFPGAARRAGHLPRQIDLCALRDHRQRHPAGARLGRPCDAGILQHHAASRQGLRQRRRVPVPVPRRATSRAKSATPTAPANIWARRA